MISTRGDRSVVALLGGSSAFAPALAVALAVRAGDLPPLELRLLGRDAGRAAAVARACAHAAAARGAAHRYTGGTDLEDAVRGASVVVNMVRAGGWSGRRHDERFPLRFGVPGDETLGPGGLAAGWRGAPFALAAARAVARHAPRAWLVSLANPLGILQRAVDGLGSVRSFGLCELPAVTLRRALALIGIRTEDVRARYAGFNHQGAFVEIARDGRALLPRIHEAIEGGRDGAWFRVSAPAMRRVAALPVPYMRLHLERDAALREARARPVARADELAALSARLFESYGRDPATLPPALREREMPWLDEAVVPALVALLGGPPASLYVSMANDGRLAFVPRTSIVEEHAIVDAGGPQATAAPLHESAVSPDLVTLWRGLAAYEERAAEAVVSRRPDDVAAALAAHPWRFAVSDLGALAEAVMADPELAAAEAR